MKVRSFCLFFLLVSGFTPLMGQIGVNQFGASPMELDNGPAIQAAIDSAGRAGGGTVVIPPGLFRSGPLKIRAGIRFELQAGAVLQAIPEKIQAAYPEGGAVFLSASGANQLALEGPGIIRGTGQDTLAVSRFHPLSAPAFRYHLILIEHSHDVFIDRLRIEDSEMFALVIDHCENVYLNGVTIRNNFFHQNTDGIDIGSCRNVHIVNTCVSAGDDAICFKNGSENVVISNCILETASTAIKFGTSTSGRFANIRVSNCVIHNSMVGIGMFMKDGGTIENCHFSHLTISKIADTLSVNSGLANQQIPLYIDIDLRDQQARPGTVRNITFDHIDIHSIHPVLIQGMKAQPIENLTLRNLTFFVTGGYDLGRRNKPMGFASSKFLYHDDHRLTAFARKPAYFVFAHIQGLRLENVQVCVADETAGAFPMGGVYLENVRQAEIQGIRKTAQLASGPPVVEMVDCEAVRFSDPLPLLRSPNYLRLLQTPDATAWGKKLR